MNANPENQRALPAAARASGERVDEGRPDRDTQQPHLGRLVLAARVGETIVVQPSGDPEMTVTVLASNDGRVKLQFNAHRSIQILRERLARELPPGGKILRRQPPFAA